MKPLSFDIEEVLRLFDEKKVFDLRGISNRLIREAAMSNDYAKAELGVIAYALHKLESKEHFVRNPKWGKVKQSISQHLLEAENAVKNNEQAKFLNALKTVIQSITNIDNELGNFAQNIYDKAKVKQASLAYSYGLSIEQSSALTGADQKELQSYIGFTTMHDDEPETKNISQRVKDFLNLMKE
ncbi:MAG: hypothetical protein WC462_04030 [archaeon]